MEAVGFFQFGDASVLRQVTLPAPAASTGEVLIRVRAAAVNPTDVLRRSGGHAAQMASQPRPYALGWDVAGTVEEVGPGTPTSLRAGDPVMGVLSPWGSRGAYAELVALPTRSVTRIPAGMDLAAAATIPMNGLTARMTLDVLGLKTGGWLAVTGAAGTYGSYVVQLAKAAGLKVVADAGASDRALVESLGADIVVERGDDAGRRIRDAVPGGVSGVADGAVLNQLVEPGVRDGGRIATLRHYAGEPSPRGVTYSPVHVGRYVSEWEKLDQLRLLAESNKLLPRVAGTYPMSHCGEAHRRLERGGTRGRLVLELPDPVWR